MRKRCEFLAYIAISAVAAPAAWSQFDQQYARPNITAEDASRLEEAVAKDPENLDARARLLRYYFYNNEGLAGPYGTQSARLKHIQWLIEHHPESDLTASLEATMLPGGPDSAATQEFERIRDLWKQQVAGHGDDPKVLGNAGTFLESTDRELAADLLQRATSGDTQDARWPARLADLYAKAMLDSAKPGSKSKALAKKARAELQNSNNAKLVGEAGRILAMRASQLLPDTAVLEDYNLFTEQLLVKAQALDPEELTWSATLKKFCEHPAAAKGEITASGSTAMRLRVGANVQAANLVWQTPPVYPPLAKQAKISGTVRLEAIIGCGGTVDNLRVISGHPLLLPAALEAVKQWRYRPTLVNGAPVEVVTGIDVNFSLSE